MELTKKVTLYPNQTMMKILDNLCDYRRYCWNQGLNLWNNLYDQRVKNVPADLRKKSQLAITDKTIVFSEEEQELLRLFPSPSNRVIRNNLVANKADWQYSLSSRVLQLAIKDLANGWSAFFDNKKPKKKDSKKKKRKVGKPSFRSKKNPKQGFKTDRASIKNGKLVLDKPHKIRGMVFLSEVTIYLMEKSSIVRLLKLVILIKQLLRSIVLNNHCLKQVKKQPLTLMLIILIIQMVILLSFQNN